MEFFLNKMYRDNDSEFFHDKDLNEFFKNFLSMVYHIAESRSVKRYKELIEEFNEKELEPAELKFE